MLGNHLEKDACIFTLLPPPCAAYQAFLSLVRGLCARIFPGAQGTLRVKPLTVITLQGLFPKTADACHGACTKLVSYTEVRTATGWHRGAVRSKVILQDMFPQKSVGKALARESVPQSPFLSYSSLADLLNSVG